VTLYNKNTRPLTFQNFSPTGKDVESDKWAVERRGWGKEGRGGVGGGRGGLGGSDKNGEVKAVVEEWNRILSRAAGVVNEAVQRGDSRGVPSHALAQKRPTIEAKETYHRGKRDVPSHAHAHAHMGALTWIATRGSHASWKKRFA
jgi:hypothetical protein